MVCIVVISIVSKQIVDLTKQNQPVHKQKLRIPNCELYNVAKTGSTKNEINAFFAHLKFS